jgi:uncharacterized SAM-binding protein YcdF (DUF218 family)
VFFLKKLISGFLVPSSVSLLLLAAGLALLWFTGRQRLGKILATVGLGLLLLFSTPGLAELMLTPLEARNAPLYPDARLQAAVQAAGSGAPRWVVVLSAGHIADARVPPSGQVGGAALARVIEGIRLHRLIPGSKLLLSGGLGAAPPAGRQHADLLAAVTDVCGVPRAEVVLHRSGWDTEQEAETITPLVGKDPFVLVTSASHMPRALALFRRRGAHPIPGSSYLYTMDEPGFAASDLVPSPSSLNASNAGFHEYIGLLWSKLRGRL